jgi:hypothetical protein
MHEYVEQMIGAQAIGSFLGGGLIGLATSAVMQDKNREAFRNNWVTQNTWECLKKRGYTLPNQG